MITDPKNDLGAQVSPALGLEQFVHEIHELGNGKKVRVVRDDMLINRGGTKRRTLQVLMPQIKKGELVYSATPFGYGQVAIADACKDFNKSATIFTPKLKNQELKSIFLEKAVKLGANIREIELNEGDTFAKVTYAAEQYAADNENVRHLLPSGFDSEDVIETTSDLVKAGLGNDLNGSVKEVWCVAGSGALSRSLQRAWPNALHKVVRVRSQDSTYGVDCDPGSAQIYDAEEEFAEEAKISPPFRSSANYDAKLWAKVLEHANDGALVWNM